MSSPKRRVASIGFNFMGLRGEITEESIVGLTDDVDDRIKKLSQVREDLQAAVVAVDSLQVEAAERQAEVQKLRDAVKQLQEDKETTQSLLELPKESFARVLSDGAARGRLRGRIEGTVIGLVTGGVSSYVVWYLTK